MLLDEDFKREFLTMYVKYDMKNLLKRVYAAYKSVKKERAV